MRDQIDRAEGIAVDLYPLIFINEGEQYVY
jgi:hypothetical protein